MSEGRVYIPLNQIREASVHVAIKVSTYLCFVLNENNLRCYICLLNFYRGAVG